MKHKKISRLNRVLFTGSLILLAGCSMEAPEWAPWKKKNDNPSIPVGEKRKPERQNKYDPVSMKLDEKKSLSSSIPELASIDLSDISPAAGKPRRVPADNSATPLNLQDVNIDKSSAAALPPVSTPLTPLSKDSSGYPQLSALPEIPQPVNLQQQQNNISEMQQAKKMATEDSGALPPLPESVMSMMMQQTTPEPAPSPAPSRKISLTPPQSMPIASENTAAPLPDLSNIESQPIQMAATAQPAPITLIPPASLSSVDMPVAKMPKTNNSSAANQIKQVAIEPMQIAADAGANFAPMTLDAPSQSASLKLTPPAAQEYYQAIIIPESRYSSRRTRKQE